MIFAINKKESGYALIELLAGMAVLSLLAVLAAGSLDQGRRIWERSENIVSRGFGMESLAFLRRHVVQAQPVLDSEWTVGTPSIRFKGESNQIGFVSLFPYGPDAVRIPSWITVRTPDGSTSPNLSASPAVPAEASTSPRELIGLSNLKLRYFGTADDELKDEWHQVWSNQSRLPQLIEVTVEVEGIVPPRPHKMLIRLRYW